MIFVHIKKLLFILLSATTFLYSSESKKNTGLNPFESQDCPEWISRLYDRYRSKGKNSPIKTSPSDTVDLALYYHLARSKQREVLPVAKNKEEYGRLSEEKKEKIKHSFIQFCSDQKQSKKYYARDEEIEHKMSFSTSYFSIIHPEQWQKIQELNKALCDVDKNKGKGMCGSEPKERSRLWYAREKKKNEIKKDLLEALNGAVFSIQRQFLYQPVFCYPVLMPIDISHDEKL